MSIYQPTQLQPNNIGIDLLLNQTFSCIVGGSLIDAYRLKIYKLDNTLLYDSTKTTLITELYNGESLEIPLTGGTVTYKGQLKFTIEAFNDVNSALSKEMTFYNATTPTLSLSVTSPITVKSNEFITTYTQAENVTVESYKYYLYDSTGLILLQSSNEIYSSKLTYTFDGFLNNTTYNVKNIITNQYGMISNTGLVEFNIEYSSPDVLITPTATVVDSLSAIDTKWAGAVQILGVATGTNSYIEDYLVLGNTGLQLEDGSNIKFTLSIPQIFTETFIFNPNGFTDGIFNEFDDGVYQIGYNSTLTCFYFILNGTTIYGNTLVLNTNPYLIAVKDWQVYIIQNNTLLDRVKGWWVE